MTEVPEHLGDQHQAQVFHVAPQLGGVGSFAHEVELVVQVFVEFGHHLTGLEPLAVIAQAFDPARHQAHEGKVLLDHRQHAGPQHLDRHIAQLAIAGAHAGKVDLRDGGAGHRLAFEVFKDLVDRTAKGPLDAGHRHLGRERRHAVLQPGQFFGDVGRQQVAAGGKHLAELDEDGAQAFEGLAQTHAAR